MDSGDLEPPTDEQADYALLMVKTHRSPSLAFWTERDWKVMMSAQVVEPPGEAARVRVRTIGPGGIFPATTAS